MYNQSPFYSNSSYSSNFATNEPVFQLKHLKGTKIRSCYGCGNPIRKDVSYIPPPPHDIVVSYKERRYYRDPATQDLRLTQNDENTYYHCMLKCIQLKHPMFQGPMLKVNILGLKEIHYTNNLAI